MASAHYKGRRYAPAYMLLAQALTLSPQNAHIMLSIIKVLVYIAEHEGLNDEQRDSKNYCAQLLKKTNLSDFHRDELNNYLTRINVASPPQTATVQ